jgi:hypothetical protein
VPDDHGAKKGNRKMKNRTPSTVGNRANLARRMTEQRQREAIATRIWAALLILIILGLCKMFVMQIRPTTTSVRIGFGRFEECVNK